MVTLAVARGLSSRGGFCMKIKERARAMTLRGRGCLGLVQNSDDTYIQDKRKLNNHTQATITTLLERTSERGGASERESVCVCVREREGNASKVI